MKSEWHKSNFKLIVYIFILFPILFNSISNEFFKDIYLIDWKESLKIKYINDKYIFTDNKVFNTSDNLKIYKKDEK